MAPISIIVTYNVFNRGIQFKGSVPYILPDHVARTYFISENANVVMCKNTWDALDNKPMPSRTNIVITDEPVDVVGVYSYTNVKTAIEHHSGKATYVIGGKKVYNETLKWYGTCVKVYATELYTLIACDTVFPELVNFTKTYISNAKTKDNGICYQYVLYTPTHAEHQYLNIIRDISNIGEYRPGTGTLSVFGRQLRFSLRESFPLLTTKRMFWKGVVEELLWFISGTTNIKPLQQKGVRIWDSNATDEFLQKRGLNEYVEGELGPVYGFQWRHYGATFVNGKTDYTGEGIDQLKYIIDTLKTDPYSRRMLLTAWNPSDLCKMALPPCHVSAQFYVSVDNELSCHMYQRSCDVGLGVPFNIASYSLLTCMLAHVCGFKRGDFVYSLGDTHIYTNQYDKLLEQIEREPFPFPKLYIIREVDDIDDFTYDDFKLDQYLSHSPLPLPLTV